MNNRGLFLRSLMLLVGSALLFYSLYQVYIVATMPVNVVNGEHAGSYLRITYNFGDVILESILAGILLHVAAGLLLVSLGANQVKWEYWSLQIALWLVGLTLWFKASSHLDPFPVDTWTWLLVTAGVSLLLLVLYRPLLRVLARFVGLAAR